MADLGSIREKRRRLLVEAERAVEVAKSSSSPTTSESHIRGLYRQVERCTWKQAHAIYQLEVSLRPDILDICYLS